MKTKHRPIKTVNVVRGVWLAVTQNIETKEIINCQGKTKDEAKMNLTRYLETITPAKEPGQ
jgi:hypothetical protein